MIFADTIVFFLKWIQRVTTRWMVIRLAKTHSGLGGAAYAADGRWLKLKALLLIGPITWGTFFLSILLYAVALLIINRLLIATEKPGLDAPRPSYPSVLWFCFKILALCAMSAILVTALTLLLTALHHDDILQSPLFLYGILVLVAMGIACCMSPLAGTLLSASASRPLTTAEASRARISAALAILASLAVSLLLQHAGKSLVVNRSTSAVMVRGIAWLSSLLSSIPYIPLFSALSLIAANKDSENGILQTPETALDSC